MELSRQLYEELVRPVLYARFEGLPHGAGLIGRVRRVLGYDDEMSTDHDWAAKVLLFLTDDDLARHGEEVDRVLRRDLPETFRDRPVRHELHSVRGTSASGSRSTSTRSSSPGTG
jgi:hypothetical protein